MTLTPERRAEKEVEWDPRSPEERFDGLSRAEQTAFRAFFHGARTNLQLAYRADTETVLPLNFGKAECEWVPINFWRYKLPGLRFIDWREEPARTALGMCPGSVVVPITIVITDDGWAAYDYSTKPKAT